MIDSVCVYFRASFMTKTILVDGSTFKFQIWDTAGQEKVKVSNYSGTQIKLPQIRTLFHF